MSLQEKSATLAVVQREVGDQAKTLVELRNELQQEQTTSRKPKNSWPSVKLHWKTLALNSVGKAALTSPELRKTN
ncbi:MAG: hypothetical protein HY281_12120 [Nitrospirae bacterium]|nr:hypothetical protein [Nitrospirota bacterium]